MLPHLPHCGEGASIAPAQRKDPAVGNEKTTMDRILQFNEHLAGVNIAMPPGFRIVNPFSGPGAAQVREVTNAFYKRFYDDQRPRRLVLGSSPARRGTAVTGVPFADAELLESECGAKIEGYAVSRGSVGFLDEVVGRYGGHDRFYADFVMNFVCPLGLVRANAKGREVNANYYENRALLESLRPFILDSLRRQMAFAVDSSVCYCIGSGENFRFLSEINQSQKLFKRVEPLEHPRYIAQYNPGRKGEFVDKYVTVLRG